MNLKSQIESMIAAEVSSLAEKISGLILSASIADIANGTNDSKTRTLTTPANAGLVARDDSKRGPGRPKGSRNKPKVTPEDVAKMLAQVMPVATVAPVPVASTAKPVVTAKRGPGRPKGSRNGGVKK